MVRLVMLDPTDPLVLLEPPELLAPLANLAIVERV